MTPPRPGGRTRDASQGAYRTYLRKATDFARLASLALGSGNANGAGLAAIHAVITTCDSLTSFHQGIRSAAEGHEEVAELVRGLRLEGGEEKVRQIRSVLHLKNLIEYEDREVEHSEAARLVTQAERILTWARRHLPSQP